MCQIMEKGPVVLGGAGCRSQGALSGGGSKAEGLYVDRDAHLQ